MKNKNEFFAGATGEHAPRVFRTSISGQNRFVFQQNIPEAQRPVEAQKNGLEKPMTPEQMQHEYVQALDKAKDTVKYALENSDAPPAVKQAAQIANAQLETFEKNPANLSAEQMGEILSTIQKILEPFEPNEHRAARSEKPDEFSDAAIDALPTQEAALAKYTEWWDHLKGLADKNPKDTAGMDEAGKNVLSTNAKRAFADLQTNNVSDPHGAEAMKKLGLDDVKDNLKKFSKVLQSLSPPNNQETVAAARTEAVPDGMDALRAEVLKPHLDAFDNGLNKAVNDLVQKYKSNKSGADQYRFEDPYSGLSNFAINMPNDQRNFLPRVFEHLDDFTRRAHSAKEAGGVDNVTAEMNAYLAKGGQMEKDADAGFRERWVNRIANDTMGKVLGDVRAAELTPDNFSKAFQNIDDPNGFFKDAKGPWQFNQYGISLTVFKTGEHQYSTNINAMADGAPERYPKMYASLEQQHRLQTVLAQNLEQSAAPSTAPTAERPVGTVPTTTADALARIGNIGETDTGPDAAHAGQQQNQTGPKG